ncbi:MAG TPA: histidine phosphatase family protein [Acidimicrobiales bacterium]|nr:histidine phosphatase family protein [Acidimicrobiales bacterium]
MAHHGGTAPRSAPTTMLVVRHGQTTWNAEKRWQGRANSPLSALGIAQAQSAARVLEPVDLVVTSTLSRARDTGAIIGDAVGAPVTAAEDLVERDVGAWTGLTFDEIEAGWPGALAKGEHPEGWEPDEAVAARALAALRRIATEHPGARVLVVTHGGLIRSVERVLGIESPYLANLGGLRVTIDGDDVVVDDRVEIIDHDAVAATVPASE